MRAPWRACLRRLAHRHRTLHAKEQWHLAELQACRQSMCRVTARMDHVRAVMEAER